MTSPLGPQCLSCKKRRVKCDSEQPSCRRCGKDELTCPGYVHVRQWKPKVSKVSSRKRKNPPPTPPDSSDSTDSAESTVVTPTAVTALAKIENSHRDPLSFYIPSWVLRPTDRDTARLINSIDYFNTFLIPSVVPAHRPFRRDQQQLPYLHDMPKLVQHTLIATIRITQVKFSKVMNPVTDAETCHYKALVLSGLRNSIDQCELDSVVLTAMISMINFELQVGASNGAWTYHLEAARKAITAQGGFGRCVDELLWVRSPLITYAFCDIIGATTSHSRSLTTELVEFQAQYVDFIAQHQDFFVIHGRPCPGRILQAMVASTTLRADINTDLLDERAFGARFSSILDSIERFEPMTWADTIAVSGEALPLRLEARAVSTHIDGWISLAICFQQATLLYLCLSCPPPASSYPSEDLQLLLRSAKQKLSQHIRHLLKISFTDYDAPVETQLWKFISWPIVISAYVQSGWDLGEESKEKEIQRLRCTAEAVSIPSSSTLRDGAEMLEDIQRRRRECGRGGIWRWDDGFKAKTVFI